jgi:hypothetical protein
MDASLKAEELRNQAFADITSAPDVKTIRDGQTCLGGLRQSWENWIGVGRALLVGRTVSMRAAHTNKPQGRAYNETMGQWLAAYGFDKVPQTTRHDLFACMDNLDAIQTWRSNLEEADRGRWNDPGTVLNRWRRSQAAEPRQKHNGLRQRLAERETELARLRREVERGGGDLWAPEDRAEDIAAVMVKRLSRYKAEKTARVMLAMLCAARARHDPG